MRRPCRWASFLALVFVPLVLVAQHQPRNEPALDQAEEHAAPEDYPNLIWWKWANFALLVGALGYVIAKNAGPFFASRTRQIRQDIEDAQTLRAQAEARMAAMDARLASLQKEIEALRQEALEEQSAEAERVRQETRLELAKLQAHAEQEITSAGKAARMELRRYAARLAVGLAREKMQDRLTPAVHDALLRALLRSLDQPASSCTAQLIER